MKTPFWIEKAWGDQVENATMDDLRNAVRDTINMDEEHGAFWVGHYENENVLEVHKTWKSFTFSVIIQMNSLEQSSILGKKLNFYINSFSTIIMTK